MRSGNSNEAFRLFTGRKGTCVELATVKTQNDLMQLFGDTNRYARTISTFHADPSNFKQTEQGLLNNHSYTVVRFYKDKKSENGYLLLRDQCLNSKYNAEIDEDVVDMANNDFGIRENKNGFFLLNIKNINLFNSFTYFDLNSSANSVPM